MPGVNRRIWHAAELTESSLPHPTMVQLFPIAIATVGQRNERRGKKEKEISELGQIDRCMFHVDLFLVFSWITDSPPSNAINYWSTGPDWMAGRIECVSVCLLTQSISSAELLDLVSRKPAADWDLLPNGCADWKTENPIGQEQDL